MEKKCLNCNKELDKRKMKYCSINCQKEYQSRIKIQQWLSNSDAGTLKDGTLSATIRNYLLKKANYQCQKCNWNEKNPVTNTVPLEIHHIDGNYLNNNINNLQVLCPNCHSLTYNYRSLNNSTRNRTISRKTYCIDCKKEISPGSLRCVSCAAKAKIKEKVISREELKNLIRTLPFTKIGDMFNVTDNAIRKWCIYYNLPSKKKDIKLYSQEEWNII